MRHYRVKPTVEKRMSNFLIFTTITLYSTATFILLWPIIRRKQRSPQSQSRSRLLLPGLIAFTLHGFVLYQSIIAPSGINLGIFKAMSLVSWMIVGLILLTSIRKPVECLGIVLFPLAIITLTMDRYLFADHIIVTGGSWQLQAHIFTSIAAYSVLTVAMVQSIILAIQDKHLRQHQPGGFIGSLPPLATMEKLLFQIIGIGFILLTIGLLIGLLFMENLFSSGKLHKTILSVLAWSFFAILLWGRFKFGWRGRMAIRWALSGFIMLMLAFIGTKTVLELILHR